MVLFDDLHDAPAARLHDDGMVIDDGIPVAGLIWHSLGTSLSGYALSGQHGADAHLLRNR